MNEGIKQAIIWYIWD